MSKKLPEPIGVKEKYLHAQVVRLDALCHMMSTLIEHIAEKENISVESNKVEEKPAKRTTRKRKTEKE